MYPSRDRERELAQEKAALAWPVGGFLTHEKAEEGFMRLLRHEDVDETWTWDQTMRKIITQPLYKALDTLAEKKAAFEKVSCAGRERVSADAPSINATSSKTARRQRRPAWPDSDPSSTVFSPTPPQSSLIAR
jgi:hypothetical protein